MEQKCHDLDFFHLSSDRRSDSFQHLMSDVRNGLHAYHDVMLSDALYYVPVLHYALERSKSFCCDGVSIVEVDQFLRGPISLDLLIILSKILDISHYRVNLNINQLIQCGHNFHNSISN